MINDLKIYLDKKTLYFRFITNFFLRFQFEFVR
jgi:hypothetical protein